MNHNKNNNEIIKEEIKELHSSILEISKSSFEIKKLCVTTIGIFNGFFLSELKFEEKSVNFDTTLIFVSILITLAITVLFHITDATTYYYQRKNRKKQTEYKNEILINENKSLLTFHDTNWFSSIFNMSMTMYMVLYGIIILTVHLQYQNNLSLTAFISYIITYIFIIIKKNKKSKKIFVSYTTRDNSIDHHSLEYLDKILKENKFTCYIDLLHNNSINKQEKVYRELLSCDIFLAIKSSKYNESEWAMRELQIAQDVKKTIITIEKIDKTQDIIKKIKKVTFR
ncbi:TPA: toll/interleukin-1 receptor domain-containing protein [Providencia rettgeri]|nr:toll/interleukin-1 receptor domain-containing protein [Providencia rettgeri]HEM8267841.1 toll/interleukin-1 receptor domain-containing protein [Providencia rettgeri]